jgi:hypothetical protein
MKMLLALGLVLITTGCVTSTVDEMVFNEPLAGIGDSTVVILGRRHASDYETEPDFIECVGDHISRRDNSITVQSDSAGSMTCGIGPGGAGCFGFGTWSNDSNYEAVIWDFTDQAEVGRVNTTATGQSYMPAVVVPIPIIAPVQGTACDGIGDQLLEFLSSEY